MISGIGSTVDFLHAGVRPRPHWKFVILAKSLSGFISRGMGWCILKNINYGFRADNPTP